MGEFTTFCPAGRYRRLHIEHQLLPWQARKQGLIKPLGLKIYCALHEMAERRRYRPASHAHFHVPECHKLLGSRVRVSEVEREIENMSTICLVHWSPSALQFTTQPAAIPGLDLSSYTAMRVHVHPKREWVPLSRRMLRYLAHEGSSGLIASVFYVSRHCYWDRTQGVCAGAVDPSALAACCGFSERTASRHLTTLEALGWFTTEPRPRWYERKYGRWCVLTPTWQAPKHPPSPARPSRPRRPKQLFLPLLENTTRAASSPLLTPVLAASVENQEGVSSPLRAARPSESVDADPPPGAQVIRESDTGKRPEDGCTILSGAGEPPCKNLSGCTSTTSSNDANSLEITFPNPFQEICLKHQIPTPQADPPLPTASPTPAALVSSPAASGVCHDEQTKPETSQRPPDMDALEAIYTTLSPEDQATLRAQAEAVLIQQGTKRDFLVWPAILSKIGRLLEAQDTREPRGAPILASDPFPPRTSTAGGSAEALASHAPAAHVAPRSDRKPKRKPLPPTLNHILIEDLQETGRLLGLLDQAREQGLIGKTPPDRLTFFAMAAHALRVGEDNPCGLFAALLHDEKLRLFLTDADDDAARIRLNAYDFGIDPQRRAQPPPPEKPPALSKDAWILRELQREFARKGCTSTDILAELARAFPAIPRERWYQASAELAEAQHTCQQANALIHLGALDTAQDCLASPTPENLECSECGAYGPACACRDAEDVA